MGRKPSKIYKAKRLGQYGEIFNLLKIRTMVPNADRIGGSSTASDDPRITRVGRVLRKYKLDELPQLYNLLKGDITLIGWRPESPEYLHTIPQVVLNTKPGLIGLATLWDIDEGEALKGKKDPDKYYVDNILRQKRKLEVYYVHNKSFKLDAKILWLTIKKLLGILGSKSLI